MKGSIQRPVEEAGIFIRLAIEPLPGVSANG
jgi:hypothetical protein